jgi:hypothetical protein
MLGMYVRSIKRKNKDGSEVEHIQLAHNTRHPEKGYSRAEIAYSFGRRDQLDVAALKRLVSSLSRISKRSSLVKVQADGGLSSPITRSRPNMTAISAKKIWNGSRSKCKPWKSNPEKRTLKPNTRFWPMDLWAM